MGSLIQPSTAGNTTFDYRLLSPDGYVSQDIYATGFADFSLTLSRSFLNVARGSTGLVEVIVSGTDGFSDTVGLSLSISPAPGTPTTDCITAKVDPNVVTLSPGQTRASVLVTLIAYEPRLVCYPPLGTYTVSVFGTAQTPPLPTREARLTLTFLNPARQGAYLLFELGYRGLPYPGATIQLMSNFTNIGSVQVRVTAISIETDFEALNQTLGLPSDLTLEQKETLTLTTGIPSGTPPGEYGISAVAHWQYLNMSTWAEGGSIAVTGNLSVVQPFNPWSFLVGLGPLSGIVLAGLLAYVAATSLVVVLVIRRERLRRQALAKALATSTLGEK